MSESKKKSGGNFNAQSEITIGRNERLKAVRHQLRMEHQCTKTLKVPRGTARNARRHEKQMAYSGLI